MQDETGIIQSKFVEEAQTRLSVLDPENQVKKSAIQRYALFIQDSEALYNNSGLAKDLPGAAIEFKTSLFSLVVECRNDMDEIIGHKLVERLFGSDFDMAALYLSIDHSV